MHLTMKATLLSSPMGRLFAISVSWMLRAVRTFSYVLYYSHQICADCLWQGDTFLRSAYVVYDLDNEEISLANTLFNVTESKILEIGTGKNSVPDATGALSAVTVAPSGEGGRINSTPYVTGYMTRAATGTNPTETSRSAAPALNPSLLLSAIAVVYSSWTICVVL